MYQATRVSALMALTGRFLFHHHDLCRFHQMFSAELARLKTALDEDWDDFRQKVESVREELRKTPDAEAEYFEVQASRVREGLRSRDLELGGSRAFADQLFVIGLWASVEQFVGKALQEAEALVIGLRRASPHRWPQMEARFAALGVDLSTCASYAGANECRVLNNKLKHVGIVDQELNDFPAFRGKLGSALEEVEFELQRYSDSVFEFVGDSIEHTDAVLPPVQSRP